MNPATAPAKMPTEELDSELDGELDGEAKSTEIRLLTIVEGYLDQVQRGSPFDPQAWIDQACQAHPDLADSIRETAGRIDALESMASIPSTGLPSIPDHTVHHEIGRGGMGIVYEATENGLGRRVAIKTVPTGLSDKPMARFLIEAQAAARLDHPHITPVHRFGVGAGLHFISMKLIDGESIEALLAQQNVELDRSLGWIIAAADALEHAHQCGVIHRDVKPSNLLIDRNDHLWVSDFGLARLSDRDGDAVSLTATGDLVGTLAYMSPEQIAGDAVDGRTDVYALGLTLFEMVTGQRAILGTTRAEILGRRHDIEAFHVRAGDRSLPKDLDTVIAKATMRKPSDRYATAGDFAADLRRLRRREPIVAIPPTLARRASRWAARHRRVVVIAMAVMVLMTAGSLVSVWRITAANRATAAALENSRIHLARTERILDQFGLMATDQLRHVDGAQDVRRELLRQTLGYYQSFADSAGDDPAMVIPLAITHFKAAQIVGELGAHDDAIAAYETAKAGFESAENLTPDQSRLHGLCLNNLAVLRAATGDLERSNQLYESAIDIQTRRLLVVAPEQRSPAALDLAKSLGNLGLSQWEAGRTDQAIECFESGLATIQPEHSNPANRDEEAEVIAVRAMLGSHLALAFRGRDDDRARRITERSIEQLRPLHEQALSANRIGDPNRSLVSRSLAAALSNRATLSVSQSPSDAVRDYREAVAILGTLVKRQRFNRAWARELAITENNLGRLLVYRGEWKAGIECFENAAKTLETLVQSDPGADHYRSSLGGVLHNLSRAQAAAGDTESARMAMRRSVEIQKTSIRDDGDYSPHAAESRAELLRWSVSDLMRLGDG